MNLAKTFKAAVMNLKLNIQKTMADLEKPTREFLEKAAALFEPSPALVPIKVENKQPQLRR